MARVLRGERYLTRKNEPLAKFIAEELRYLDYYETCAWYEKVAFKLDLPGQALLGANDRYYLFTGILGRVDGLHPWLFERAREVEAEPDGYIDLWSRFHYKSSLISFAGAIQEIICDPEITIVIFSVVRPIAQAFLSQIKEELEGNERLKDIYPDVFYRRPRTLGPDGRPAKWSLARGITVKRKSNPKEATIEAHGLIDGQPTSRHFRLHIYDDVVTQDYLSEDQVRKTTERWEMADNLGSHLGVRKWMPGTRYSFADTYGTILERRSLKPRIYPATHDGTLTGKPVFLSDDRWAQLKNDQRSTVSAQMLQNPIAGNENTFNPCWLTWYEVFPSVMNVYVLCDPSKGSGQRSDRSAIAVIGVDPGGNKYLLDGVRHRMKLTDRWDFIKLFKRKWEAHRGVQMVRIGYERYGMLSDLEVIQDMMQRENNWFEIVELNTPHQGGHSKNDRIERLEPDIREGRFKLPVAVYNPEFNPLPETRDGQASPYAGNCFWAIWTPQHEKLSPGGGKNAYKVGQILYRPMAGLTKRMAEVTSDRVCYPLRRRDEDGKIYDLTLTFINEARLHPFGSHDDMIDACSRIYDMDPQAPVAFQRQSTEPLDIEDSGGGFEGIAGDDD